MKAVLAISFLVVATQAVAQCPDVVPPDPRRALLMDQVRIAQSNQQAQLLTNQLWAIWASAPDTHAQEILDEGMQRRSTGDLDGAQTAFDALVAYCPDYAEGYNQRAFVNFLRQDFAAALPDLDRAIELSPRHVAAIAGRALTLAGMERRAEAALSLREALALNPWLSERHLLPSLEAGEQEL